MRERATGTSVLLTMSPPLTGCGIWWFIYECVSVFVALASGIGWVHTHSSLLIHHSSPLSIHYRSKCFIYSYLINWRQIHGSLAGVHVQWKTLLSNWSHCLALFPHQRVVNACRHVAIVFMVFLFMNSWDERDPREQPFCFEGQMIHGVSHESHDPLRIAEDVNLWRW